MNFIKPVDMERLEIEMYYFNKLENYLQTTIDI